MGCRRRWKLFFWPAKGVKIFSTPCVYPQNAQIFVKNSNMGEKDEKFRPPDPTFKSAIGCWPIHVSLVTRHSVGGGGVWGWGDRYVHHWLEVFTAGHPAQPYRPFDAPVSEQQQVLFPSNPVPLLLLSQEGYPCTALVTRQPRACLFFLGPAANRYTPP